MSINSTYYSEDVKKIDKIEFSIYKNKDVKLYSAVSDDPFGIDLAESYENYEPKKGGLVDLRLGTCDIYLSCTTCGENSLDCPGHFGHTELAEPVFHFGFLTHLKNLLQCICLKCSNILIEKTDINFKKALTKKAETRFKEMKSLTKNVNFCYHCGVPVPKIKREVKDSGSIKIMIERDLAANEEDNVVKKIKESLSPRDCYNILRNISDNDCYLLGFNPKMQRPDDLIIDKFPIPPVIIRPTAKVDFMSSATMEDSLTLKISDIVTCNKRVRQNMLKETIGNETSTYGQDMFNLLQYNVATFFDNESVSLPRTEFKTGGKATKSISDRIKGKTGRVRSNLMGKRVDFSARSVITSDPYINIDQVGVPKRIAMELTIPEEVTPVNIKYLTGLVKNGRDIYPGANFILRVNYRDGKPEIQKIDLKYRKKEIKLNFGDIIERHCIDGDYVLFNRQPSLHKPSVMGHMMQVIDNDNLNTFRMNVSVCKPYNADFDGDEMNIFLAQSIQAINELKRIANVQFQIVSVKNSSPIIGCQQDTLSGAYMLTGPNVRMKGWEIANILCNTTSETKMDINMDKEYTGHEIFSHIIPSGINNIKKSGDKITLEIIDGKLKSGYLDTSALSFAKNSIIHFIWDKWGPSKTRRFIDDSQRLVLNYLLSRGQTVGFKDIVIEDDIKNKIEQIVSNDILKSKYNITQYENDNEQLSLGIIEDSLTSELDIVCASIGKLVMNHFDMNNFFWISAISGAKGNLDNVAKMVGVIGQCNVEGVRIKKRIENRSMIYFHKDDDTPEARGFIKSSFLTGLKGYEFAVNAAAGREGLIDTAIRTAQTGYIQRQLIKGLEDLSIKYDGTNRNARGTIIQTIYGENGINQSAQTEIVLNILRMDNKTLEEKLGFSDAQIKKLKKFTKVKEFNTKYINKLIKFRDNLRQIQANAIINFKIIEDKFVVPVNLYRITQAYTTSKESLELDPQYIEDAIENFLNDYDNRLIIALKPTDKYMKQDDRNVKYLLEIALNEYLAPVKCIFTYNLTKKSFDEMMQEIKMVFIKSMIEPGEMVGIIAAQSIGEPTSQLTLNTKHSAGKAKSTTTSGVSRIQELLHYSKNIKTPEMTIYFKEPQCYDRAAINKIASYFKYLSIRYLIAQAEIYYDIGVNDELGKKLKSDNVSNPFFINNQKADVNSLPFVFRLKMDIEKMLDKETTLLDIKTKFVSHWYKNYTNIKNLKKNEKEVVSKISRCAILSNNLNEKEQIIHIRFNMSSFNYNIITEFFRMVFDDIPLKGIDNINNINIVQEPSIRFDEKTGAIKNNEKEYVVYTSGINIEKMRQIKNIDFTRTKCNDTATILRLYGIEATRQIIIHELLIAFSGSSINHNHMAVLIDQMCHLGEIVSIDRHGLSKIATDPITRASFEKTMDHFVNAALFNEKDYLNSISSQIAVGQAIRAGTGIFDLLLDTKKIENSEYTENETGGRITFNSLEEEPLLQDIMKYSIGKTDFFIPN